MALGFQSGEFKSYIKVDARSGRITRRKNAEAGEQSDVDITDAFKAVFDMGNIKQGWAMFANGTAPAYVMADLSQPYPPKPGEGFKQGFLMDVALPPALGGGVHEFSSTAKAVRDVISALHTEYSAAPEAAAGKLPVVAMNGSTTVESKMPNGTVTRNYAPRFTIAGWVDRPAALTPGAPAAASAQATAKPAPAPAATPAATNAANAASNDMAFG